MIEVAKMSNIKFMAVTFIFTVFIFLSPVIASATSHLISLQGYATDTADKPLATGNITVRIYDAATSGNLIYNSGTDYNGAISNGIFDVLLGSITPLSLDNTVKYYMEVDINGQEVVGDATAGRKEFWPGGGNHTHTHVAEDITGGNLVINGLNVLNVGGNKSKISVSYSNFTNWRTWYIQTPLSRNDDKFAISDSYPDDVNWARLVIDSSGNVGIGTVSPTYKLDVAGSANAQQLCIAGDCKSSWPSFVGGSGTDNYIPRWNGANNLETSSIYQNDAGNVGIGTSNPTSKLEVSGDIHSSSIQLGNSAGSITENWWEFGKDDGLTSTGIDFHGGSGAGFSDYTARIYRYSGNNADFIILNRGTGSLVLGTDNSNQLTIKTGGNVGIGTTNPTSKLEVAGNAKINGTAIVGGELDVSQNTYIRGTLYHKLLSHSFYVLDQGNFYIYRVAIPCGLHSFEGGHCSANCSEGDHVTGGGCWLSDACLIGDEDYGQSAILATHSNNDPLWNGWECWGYNGCNHDVNLDAEAFCFHYPELP